MRQLRESWLAQMVQHLDGAAWVYEGQEHRMLCIAMRGLILSDADGDGLTLIADAHQTIGTVLAMRLVQAVLISFHAVHLLRFDFQEIVWDRLEHHVQSFVMSFANLIDFN